ncbi:MAG: alpha-ketoglutarate-dependent dioxygenase AlkB [Bacteriovoracaceae bacterium]|nr:alpha-ketoglutarate-dependent dioxygenase AlkB [Bacteriovoracaceae bacterium]
MKNILPYDGVVKYYGQVWNQLESQKYFELLMRDILWENDQAIIFGRHLTTKRKVAWYGSHPFSYTYSKVTKHAHLWLPFLSELKEEVEGKTGATYNSCLLNLYHNGSEGMAWHSDGEKDLKKHGTIASLSFGAERKFCFKHKIEKEKIDIILEKGSLLTMEGTTQDHWLHRLPPTKKIHEPRINLTFRTIINTDYNGD